MPATVRSSRTINQWQQDRATFTPRKTYSRATVSVAAPEASSIKSGGWASLMATAHEAYTRDRQMTTDERVEMELRKLARRDKNRERDVLSGTTALFPEPGPVALTADALTALGRQDIRQEEMDHNDDSAPEIVPSMNYAVAELAKSLEESRKAIRKALKENEELRAENNALKVERKRRQDLEVQLRGLKNWVSPETHTKLRTGWEEWADIAEKKIESLSTKVGKANEDTDALVADVKQKKITISKLEDRLKGFHDWTSPHERKVLDATIDMLNNNLDEMKAGTENCQGCAQRQTRAGRRPLLDVTKPVLGRQKTVA